MNIQLVCEMLDICQKPALGSLCKYTSVPIEL